MKLKDFRIGMVVNLNKKLIEERGLRGLPQDISYGQITYVGPFHLAVIPERTNYSLEFREISTKKEGLLYGEYQDIDALSLSDHRSNWGFYMDRIFSSGYFLSIFESEDEQDPPVSIAVAASSLEEEKTIKVFKGISIFQVLKEAAKWTTKY